VLLDIDKRGATGVIEPNAAEFAAKRNRKGQSLQRVQGHDYRACPACGTTAQPWQTARSGPRGSGTIPTHGGLLSTAVRSVTVTGVGLSGSRATRWRAGDDPRATHATTAPPTTQRSRFRCGLIRIHRRRPTPRRRWRLSTIILNLPLVPGGAADWAITSHGGRSRSAQTVLWRTAPVGITHIERARRSADPDVATYSVTRIHALSHAARAVVIARTMLRYCSPTVPRRRPRRCRRTPPPADNSRLCSRASSPLAAPGPWHCTRKHDRTERGKRPIAKIRRPPGSLSPRACRGG
jgi:hypothetical protein